MDKKATLEKWFQEVWTNENTAAIHEMFVPEADGSARGLGQEEGMGPNEFAAFQQAFLGIAKNVSVHIDSYIESGDIISAQCTMIANDRATGEKELVMKGCAIVRVVGGKLVNASNYFDFLSLFEQMGLLPPNTFASCLSGESVC